VEISMKIFGQQPARAAVLALFLGALASVKGWAGEAPAPKQGEWIAHEFRFHGGEVLAELRLRFTTLGNSSGEPVLILHGTGGSGAGLLTDGFAGRLFGAGQPLDIAKYFIILPDAIGHGGSSKPSDGLRMRFPNYDYDDQVEAAYRLLNEGLGVHHLRLVAGISMGGMETWLWGEKYPGFMDALAPMAAQPTPMASRNWMLRRLMIETLRNDPEWMNGEYKSEPHSLRLAYAFYTVATNGGTLAYQHLAPTRAKADKLVGELLAKPFSADANDFLYQWESSADYDPSENLERIEATVLAVNSTDDERDPPETGVTERAIERVKNARLYLIPASEQTRGHGTAAMAKFYAEQLGELLATAPRR
jgi:homoserine O-acetyltransferase/O-succinyltransferase